MRQSSPIPPDRLLKEQLSPEEREMIEALAAWTVRRGMALPAIMFLEPFKPLSYVASQTVVFFRAGLEIFADPVKIATLISLMENRENVELLLREIETRDNEYQKEIKALKAKRKEEKRLKKADKRKRKEQKKLH